MEQARQARRTLTGRRKKPQGQRTTVCSDPNPDIGLRHAAHCAGNVFHSYQGYQSYHLPAATDVCLMLGRRPPPAAADWAMLVKPK